MKKGLIGKKIGMTQIFNEEGKADCEEYDQTRERTAPWIHGFDIW